MVEFALRCQWVVWLVILARVHASSFSSDLRGTEIGRGFMATNESKIIDLEQGWEFVQKGVIKLENILEGLSDTTFSSEEYMALYDTIYRMCTQEPPHDYSQQLYDRYKEVYEEYITSKVIPSLREKHGELMLTELVKRWSNHKLMVYWLSRFFHYLDRYFIPRRSLPPLNEVGLTSFHDLVYRDMHAGDSVIALIEKEPEGDQIDRVAYCSSKVSNWAVSHSDYIIKDEDCLKQEMRAKYDL